MKNILLLITITSLLLGCGDKPSSIHSTVIVGTKYDTHDVTCGKYDFYNVTNINSSYNDRNYISFYQNGNEIECYGAFMIVNKQSNVKGSK